MKVLVIAPLDYIPERINSMRKDNIKINPNPYEDEDEEKKEKIKELGDKILKMMAHLQGKVSKQIII